MPKLIDIHCHLDFNDFDKDREEVIKRTLDDGLWLINIGTCLETSRESIKLAEKYDLAPLGGGIFASVGLHPTDKDDENFVLENYYQLAQHPKVVAIGECGIDMFRREVSDLERQKDIFRKQVELAIELDKPLMIHCRDGHDDVLEVLEDYLEDPALRGDVHFFSGDWKTVERYLDLDFSFSFTGVITFTNQYDEVIKNLPLEKIMVETDAPFVAPVPYRGERCEPLYVKEVAKRIAKIKGLTFDEVAKKTTQNAIDFFGL
ncbi:TatD family hydrolase [Patescibacteria group bacterium]